MGDGKEGGSELRIEDSVGGGYVNQARDECSLNQDSDCGGDGDVMRSRVTVELSNCREVGKRRVTKPCLFLVWISEWVCLSTHSLR